MQYSFKKGLVKGVKYFVLFLLPILVNKFVFEFPGLAQLTVGGLLVMAVNYLKVRVQVRNGPTAAKFIP